MGSKSYHNSFISLGLFARVHVSTRKCIVPFGLCVCVCVCWNCPYVVSGWSDQMRPHKFAHCTPNTIYCFSFYRNRFFTANISNTVNWACMRFLSCASHIIYLKYDRLWSWILSFSLCVCLALNLTFCQCVHFRLIIFTNNLWQTW